jgi:hypothetical protein
MLKRRFIMTGRPHVSVQIALAAALLCACSRSSLPDPREAATAYAHAAERADSDAIFDLLTERAQKSQGRAGARRLVEDSRAELLRQGRALASPEAKVRMGARLRYEDGEQVELDVEEGRFAIRSAGLLPTGARTPAQALGELRAALARRSYAALIRVLSAETRSAMENDLRSLVEGLEEPETLDVKVSGDTAEVEVPGGHSIRLKREAGVWRIEDFD